MWTENQQAAIDIPVADTIVSAAAGSGKTAVMAERIVKRVVSGQVDIDRLLIVTFTNAAASEIKSRLMHKIMEQLDTAEDSSNLNRQLMLINNASICTIHSFCLDIIRNNFHRLGMDPNFKIGDTGEVELLKNDVLNNIIDSYYESDDKDFLNLVDCYTTKNDSALISMIFKVYNFALSIPNGFEYLQNIADNFENDTKCFDYLLNKTIIMAKQALVYYNEAVELSSLDENLEKAKALLCNERDMFEHLSKVKSWNDAYKCLNCFVFETLRLSKEADADSCGQIKQLRTLGKKIYNDICENYITNTFENIISDISESSVFVKKIVEIAKNFEEEFSKQKRSKNIIDFSDFEHLALKLLKNSDGTISDAALKLMDKYDEIYVDEYQDCNSVQEEIFSCVSKKNQGNPNMFMVGDMKQSIYKFRDADPRLFKGKADLYDIFDDKTKKYNKILLNKNFRSRKPVLDGINSVFAQIMNETAGELKYNEDEFLYYNENSYKDCNDDMNSVDIVIIDEKEKISQSPNDEFAEASFEEELKGTEAEAVYVANRINNMVKSGTYIVFDKSAGEYRPVKYSDIVILLRSVKGYADVFNDVLTTANIPVYCDVSGGYYDAPEIVFLISILRIIDNPLDDISLLSVMRHPVFGFTDNDFVNIRICDKKGFMYDAVKKYIRLNEDELSQKLKDFTEKLEKFYERSGFLPADKLIWEITNDIDYMAYLSFLPNSELKKANVQALFNRAYDFEQTEFKGIFNFVRYIDTLKKNNTDTDTAKTLGESENVVRIMSIHKSKGLEFPVVFLCKSSKNFNFMDLYDKILLHKEYGMGINYTNYKKRISYPLPSKNAIKDKIKTEIISEEMRILYVALTRAREKLVITGSLKNAEKTIDSIALDLFSENKNISPWVTLRVRTYLEWILMSVIRNKTCLLGNGYHFDAIINDNSKFNTLVIPKNELVFDVSEDECKYNFKDLPLKSGADEIIKSNLEYEYPFEVLSMVPPNISVTELKKMQNNDDNVYEIFKRNKLNTPSFVLQTNKPSAANIGTYTHLVMEKLDFENTASAEDIKSQINNLVKKGFLTENQAKYINADNIFRLFETKLGAKMKDNFKTIKREFGFKYLLDASQINADVNTNDKIVVQGMIDAYFEDDNNDIIIVDYKTDKVSGNVDEIGKRYAPQLKYYEQALQIALGRKVKEKYLFLLDSGDVVKV